MGYTYSRRTIRWARCVEVLSFILLKGLGWLRRSPDAGGAVRSILLVEPFQLGDVISLSVLLDPLKSLWPEARITVLTQPKNGELFKYDTRVHCTATSSFPWSQGGRGSWLGMWKMLADLRRKGGFDVGIDTRGEIRSQLVMALCGCRRRVGYTNYMGCNMKIRGLLLTDNLHDVPLMHRYDINRWVVSRAWKVDLPALVFPTFKAGPINPIRVKPEAKQVVVHPGGGWCYKRWPEDRWVELIRALARREGVSVVLIGGPNEHDVVASISAQLQVPHTVKLTSFEELVGLLKGAELFIGLDSGPMNLAVTLGVRTLALFGPGNSDVWHPYGPAHFFFHPGRLFPCNSCLQKDCMFPDASCMTKIDSADVIKQALKMV